LQKIRVMKKYCGVLFLAILLSALFGYNVNAQVDSAKAERIKNQLIDSVCSCISKKDVSSIKTVDQAQALLMECFMGSGDGMSLFMDYLSASGIDMSDMAGMQAAGTKMATEFYSRCPALIQIMINVEKDTTEMKKLMEQYKNLTTPSTEPSNTPGQSKNDHTSNIIDKKEIAFIQNDPLFWVNHSV
jgi:hypothetical protein